MLNSGVKGFDRGILSEAKDIAAPDAGQPSRPSDEEEAQGTHAAKNVGVRALPGAAPRLGEGIELKAAGKVVGEDAELLPGAVGPVVTGGDDVEGELALEFRDRLLLSTAAADEGVEGRQRESHVGGDGVVLEVPVVGHEEIELEVLGALMLDVLAVDEHPQTEVPR